MGMQLWEEKAFWIRPLGIGMSCQKDGRTMNGSGKDVQPNSSH